ncbi:SET domain-containing protein 5 [Colletotrichum orbiculare MAFF 240422]|uniref:SET domain-containing protein 5 n=1 Tax=Colletotrichum orbiculare (strain 104-T / ATCC 96160 / CBS 514.97 / LARS 414 / MAFF 240422) TaxID=1213857 RepID=N4V7H1_COLOR|nr:SET domain-containing protein 5 [Colletotrichum orbiculare MAFF 240422]
MGLLSTASIAMCLSAAALAHPQSAAATHDDDAAIQCASNPSGPLTPSRQRQTCSLPFDPRRSSPSSAWPRWTHRPVCSSSSAKTKPQLCAFVKTDFRGESGLLVLTTPEVAAGDGSMVEDFDTNWVYAGPPAATPASPPPYEVKEIPGKGLGVVANAAIRAGEVVMREYPRILQTASADVLEGPERGEVMWVLEEGFVRLPREDQARIFDLARSTGGHPVEDVIRTNTFGVTFNNVTHHGLFPGIARINHACKPNAVTRFSQTTLALDVVAYRNIAPGEELSISYSPLNMLSHDRRRALREWGFNCTCALCSSPAPVLAASDARRGRVQQLLALLEQPLYRSSATLVADAAAEMERIIGDEGLEAQRGDFYGVVARVFAAAGDAARGGEYAARAVEQLAHFAGFDDERTASARGLLGELGKTRRRMG